MDTLTYLLDNLYHLMYHGCFKLVLYCSKFSEKPVVQGQSSCNEYQGQSSWMLPACRLSITTAFSLVKRKSRHK